VALALGGATITPSATAAATTLPVKNLLSGDMEAAGTESLQTLPASAAPRDVQTAYRVALAERAPTNFWDEEISETVAQPLTDGESLTLHFWACSATANRIAVVIERAGAPYDKILSQQIDLTPTWTEYTIPVIGKAFPEGAALRFQLGFASGSVQIAGERLEDPRILAAPALPASPVGADLLARDGDWTFGSVPPQDASEARVPGPADVGLAYRITLNAVPADAWGVALQKGLPEAIRRNQVMRLHFWARSVTHTPFRAVYEMDTDPYTKALAAVVSPGPHWTEYAFPFTSPPYAPNGAHVTFHLGFAKGTIELAGMRLENYGVAPAVMPPTIHLDLYGGQPHDDRWRTAANARIARYRQGNLVVHVVDARTGKAIPDAIVSVAQTRHAFRFGTAVSPLLLESSPDAERYRSTILHLFNYAVLENALKWHPESSGPSAFADADPMLAWCAAHQIPVRGHNLFWPSDQYVPLPATTSPAEMHAAVKAHVEKYVTHTRGKVVVWDVINEAVVQRSVLDRDGRDLLWLPFFWAHEADPSVDLAYNDYDISNEAGGANAGHREAAFAVVREIEAHHAPITEMGDQSHMDLPLTPGPRLVEIWNEATHKTGLPLEITEYDAGIQDDDAHAAYQDEFMTAMFSCPQLRSFVMWGFWAGAHWRASEGGAMFRNDWTPRPAVGVYERLVFHDWWTNAHGVTDGTGAYRVRGFLGDYRVTATHAGRTVSVPASVTRNQDGVTTVTVRL
jgi:GH35 family endo-1,4-beta-xylanase